jgi:hypothetical protein
MILEELVLLYELVVGSNVVHHLMARRSMLLLLSNQLDYVHLSLNSVIVVADRWNREHMPPPQIISWIGPKARDVQPGVIPTKYIFHSVVKDELNY